MSGVVGRVVAINRYPVKSMQGDRPDTAEFDLTGMVGDRRFAVRAADGDDTKVLSAKREPALLDARATGDGTDGGRPTITLPGERVIEPGDPDTDAILSRWLGRPVRLAEADAREGTAYEMSFDVDDEDRDLFEVPMQPGRFLDLCPVHVLTTASLAVMADRHPHGRWDPDRFRPGVLVEVEAGLEGLVEDGWLGREVVLGGVTIAPVMPTIRCVMTTRPQVAHALERDLEIIRTVRAVNDGNLGLYAGVRAPGRVAVGDPVSLGEPLAEGAPA